MPLIRDTIDPLNEREVSDEEALDLERMGVLLTGTRAKTPDGLTAAAVRQVTERLEGAPVTGAPAATVTIGVADPVADEDQAVAVHGDEGVKTVSTGGDDRPNDGEDDPKH